jgi:ABC-type dipeptide/oligopeptide/nickel transport system ATPase component
VNGHFPHLPASFWEQTAPLRAIRDAAFASYTSPEAVLGVVLCRVAAATPPDVRLPNFGTLDFVAAIVGESGAGKSTAISAARKVVPKIGTVADGLPPATGEGIAATYVPAQADDADDDQPQVVIRCAYFAQAEGESLLNISKRQGSTTLSTIRSAWSGETLGSANASPDRRRIVPAGSYRFALAIGFQPLFAAELLADHHAGTPQRFLYVGTTHPDQPDVLPSFPAPLDLPLAGLDDAACVLNIAPEVRLLIHTNRARRQRREVPVDPQDSHRDLLASKVAGLLAILHGDDVTVAWWTAATQVVDVSRGVRQHLLDYVQSLRDEQDAAAATRHDNRDRARILGSMVGTIAARARNGNGTPVTRSDLQQATSGQHRGIVAFDDALNEAIQQGVIVAVLVPNGRGQHYRAA